MGQLTAIIQLMWGIDPGPDNFCGSSNNDSWLQFTAADDTIVLDWTENYANNLEFNLQFLTGVVGTKTTW